MDKKEYSLLICELYRTLNKKKRKEKQGLAKFSKFFNSKALLRCETWDVDKVSLGKRF